MRRHLLRLYLTLLLAVAVVLISPLSAQSHRTNYVWTPAFAAQQLWAQGAPGTREYPYNSIYPRPTCKGEPPVVRKRSRSLYRHFICIARVENDFGYQGTYRLRFHVLDEARGAVSNVREIPGK